MTEDDDYVYLTEEEILQETFMYCTMHNTVHVYKGLTEGRKSGQAMPYPILNTLLLEEIITEKTVTTIIPSTYKPRTVKRSVEIVWRRKKTAYQE